MGLRDRLDVRGGDSGSWQEDSHATLMRHRPSRPTTLPPLRRPRYLYGGLPDLVPRPLWRSFPSQGGNMGL